MQMSLFYMDDIIVWEFAIGLSNLDLAWTPHPTTGTVIFP